VPVEAALPSLDGGVLRVESIKKAFGGNLALDDVTISAEAGRITALIGPNGSGKTTLLNVVSGYYRPDGGTVAVAGRDVSGLGAVERARAGVGRTFQTPLVPDGLTVAESLRTGAVADEAGLLATMLRLPAYRKRERQARDQVQVLAAALGLGHCLDEQASSLALGTRRLVELGRAMASRPAVLLLDEVASGLDRDEVLELGSVIRRLRDGGATVVLVEHNFDLITSIADHVYVLTEGRLLFDGTPDQVAADPRVRATYLGSGPDARRTTDPDLEGASS
jgi:branched-chain amino acid transport system permease protein